MLVVCHAEACRVMILFIGVSFQTYFITPCAREFSGRLGCICVPPSPLRSFPFLPWRSRLPAASSPLSLVWAPAPPSLSPAGSGGCAASQTSRTCSVSWGPLWTAASLATRTCHSARYGSRSSIPASGGGSSSHGRRGRYCSLVLKELSFLFI